MAQKKKILITGVAGFIGSTLAKRLVKDGYSVVGIDNLAYGLLEQVPAGVEFHKLDIRSKDIYPVFNGVDVVFHLAAKNCLPDCQKAPFETVDINILGTANVFEAVRLAKVPKIVYAQSSAVEEGEVRVRGFYAMSKRADEMVAESYMQGFGITAVGLRYFNVYGPRQDYRRTSPPLMSKFIVTFLKGEQPVLFEGDEGNKRDFIYIDDINDFHLMCIENEQVDNKVFRLGSGYGSSIAEIYGTIKKIMGVTAEALRKPRNADDPIVSAHAADIAAAEALGWHPKTSLEDGLRASVEFLRGELAAGRLK